MAARLIAHVDMDAFYAAVEQMDHPELRGKPVAVGPDPKGGKGRGVITTASYEARKFGIRSAMPVSTAYRLCPHAIFVPPRFKRYAELSAIVMECLGEFSPLVETVSIDEAFLDCTGTESLFGSPSELGRKIKARIRERTGLTASAGMAGCKSVAKVASDLQKPDGLTIVPEGGEKAFLAPLPIEKLWGVGARTAERLRSLGYAKVDDIARASREEMERLFGKWGAHIHDMASAIDPRPVAPGWQRKSISEEVTLEEDSSDQEFLRDMLSEIAESLSQKMIGEEIRGRTLHFKIRLTGFETHTRSRTLKSYVHDMKTLRDFAWEELANFDRGGRAVRLIGIGVSELLREGDEEQLDLFSARKRPDEKVDRLIFEMQEKFGGRVKRASRSKS